MRHIVLVALALTLVLTGTTVQALSQPAPDDGTLLYGFKKAEGDAGYPFSGVVRDSAGNFYGTQLGGGPRQERTFGSVYELSPPATGGTHPVETTLHVFEGPGGSDGYHPYASLVIDKSGNLYGTASEGGAHGRGIVFQMSPPVPGQTAWAYTILHSFGGELGSTPLSSLFLDGAGALFGTTSQGGSAGYGTVFQLKPPAPGETDWKGTTLYSFQSATDGCPHAAVIPDGRGNLYGTTFGCDSYLGSPGTVFELTPGTDPSAPYVETILYSFASNPNMGETPAGPLIMDTNGALYGTTTTGKGQTAYGGVFELVPPAPGFSAWTPLLLHGFNANTSGDGAEPEAGLLMNATGTLFGTTLYGGISAGTVFRLTPPGFGGTQWTETLVPLAAKVGQYPRSTLIFDGSGTELIGTAEYGGKAGYGSVFTAKP
jgi:uncharacterized repeat protein (TIGR03803 family)